MDAAKKNNFKQDNLKRYNRLRGLTSFLEKMIFSGYRLLAKHNIDNESHGVSISECTYSPWKINVAFNDMYKNICDYTLVDKRKLYELWSLSRQLKTIRGNYMEVGVWRGGSGVLLGKTLQEHGAGEKIYLCDTYEGMPFTTDAHDNFYKGGELADTSEQLVQNLANNLGLDNVVLLKGIFPRDTANKVPENAAFKLIHVDVDIYSSAKETVEWGWNRMPSGGMVVFDDYGYSATEGVTRFVNEFMEKRTDAIFVFNLCGHGIVIKR